MPTSWFRMHIYNYNILCLSLCAPLYRQIVVEHAEYWIVFFFFFHPWRVVTWNVGIESRYVTLASFIRNTFSKQLICSIDRRRRCRLVHRAWGAKQREKAINIVCIVRIDAMYRRFQFPFSSYTSTKYHFYFHLQFICVYISV